LKKLQFLYIFVYYSCLYNFNPKLRYFHAQEIIDAHTGEGGRELSPPPWGPEKGYWSSVIFGILNRNFDETT